ncbi:MipA/OmpV family protein [Vibrio sp. SCSIO 43135]|uniref:MipA/OmpV family protein n=1 Tax=Vibrio sp. SCSIO 43135 TaxID=2819096 RepID=UPI002074EAA8|nr:MipA/OmpV family protein [Vibrio sp. SCSIO 43135]USD42564.1 MipA/OmpV family protein [Vibrio sp. SCSIO 43135]
MTSGVQADISQWSLGVAASYSPAVYKDTPSNQTVIPVIGYEGEHLFLRGFSAGYRINPVGSVQNVVFRLVYDPRTLKPSDSDNEQIQKLDERDSTILGGVSYQLITMVGMFEATAGTDVGRTHNGLYAEAAWRLPIRKRGWAITPSIGYAYNSENLNNHLYGVSGEEAMRSGLTEFDADWDGQYFIGASAYLHITPRVRVTGGVRYTNLEGDIERSPIIESGVNTTANVGVAYVF